MFESEKAEFASAVGEVLGSYNQEVSKFQLRIWWVALEPYELNTVLNALGGYMSSPQKCRFAPKPGDIVEMIEGSAKDREAIAMQAWQRVMDNCNSYATTVFDDPAIHHAIHVTFGMWHALGQCDEHDLKFKRLDFIKAYCAFREGMPYPPKLIGVVERDNAAAGQANDFNAIEYIGDKQKCLAIAASDPDLALESVKALL